MRGNSRLFVFLVAIALVSPACMAYRSHIDVNAARFDSESISASGEGKRLLLTMSLRHAEVPQKAQETRAKELEEAGLEVLRASGYFSEVGTELENPDMELVVNLEEKEHFSQASAFLTGFTLLIIPTSDRVELNGTGEVFSSTGEKLAELRVEESITAWIGIILLPAIPSYFVAGNRYNADIFRSFLVQMKDQNAV